MRSQLDPKVLPIGRCHVPNRTIKTPKLYFIDPGLSTAMRGYSIARLRADRELLGSLLECFVFSELLKVLAWSEENICLFHYRDKDKLEVDFVLEQATGRSNYRVVGLSIGNPIRRTKAGCFRVIRDPEKSRLFSDSLRRAGLP